MAGVYSPCDGQGFAFMYSNSVVRSNGSSAASWLRAVMITWLPADTKEKETDALKHSMQESEIGARMIATFLRASDVETGAFGDLCAYRRPLTDDNASKPFNINRGHSHGLRSNYGLRTSAYVCAGKEISVVGIFQKSKETNRDCWC